MPDRPSRSDCATSPRSFPIQETIPIPDTTTRFPPALNIGSSQVLRAPRGVDAKFAGDQIRSLRRRAARAKMLRNIPERLHHEIPLARVPEQGNQCVRRRRTSGGPLDQFRAYLPLGDQVHHPDIRHFHKPFRQRKKQWRCPVYDHHRAAQHGGLHGGGSGRDPCSPCLPQHFHRPAGDDFETIHLPSRTAQSPTNQVLRLLVRRSNQKTAPRNQVPDPVCRLQEHRKDFVNLLFPAPR